MKMTTVERNIDEDLLHSGILILTGGQDNYGHVILTVPPHAQDRLYQHYSTAHLVVLIRHYVLLCQSVSPRRGVAVLADFQTWNKETLIMLVDALDKTQAELRGSVAVLYGVLPKARENQRALKKLTGLKHSKKNPKVPIFETILVANRGELLKFMDPKQLTEDFGGSLQYNHQHWIRFIKTIDDLEEAINKTLDKLPEASDKLAMMLEYETPATQRETEELLIQIRGRYQQVMRDVNLEHMIDECKSMLDNLNHPNRSSAYHDIMHTPSFRDAKNNIAQYERQLIKSREQLRSLWQRAESSVLSASRIQKYKGKATKILDWIQDVGIPTACQDPEVADCLSKAEILKNHFQTGFCSAAKNVVWLSGKIQKKMDAVIVATKGADSRDLAAFSRRFQASVDQFWKLVATKQQVYHNVHDFYLTSNKSPLAGVTVNPGMAIYRYLAQLAKWYRNTLTFLPVQLLGQQVAMSGHHHHGDAAMFYGSPAWHAAVDNYVLNHPPPQGRHVQRLKSVIPVVDDIHTRNQGRLLVHRVEVLCLLLDDVTRLRLPDLQDVFRWRDQILHGLDEVDLSTASSTVDLSQITPGGDTIRAAPMRHAVSVTSMEDRTPKLRAHVHYTDSESLNDGNDDDQFFVVPSNRDSHFRTRNAQLRLLSKSNGNIMHVVDRGRGGQRRPKSAGPPRVVLDPLHGNRYQDPETGLRNYASVQQLNGGASTLPRARQRPGPGSRPDLDSPGLSGTDVSWELLYGSEPDPAGTVASPTQVGGYKERYVSLEDFTQDPDLMSESPDHGGHVGVAAFERGGHVGSGEGRGRLVASAAAAAAVAAVVGEAGVPPTRRVSSLTDSGIAFTHSEAAGLVPGRVPEAGSPLDDAPRNHALQRHHRRAPRPGQPLSQEGALPAAAAVPAAFPAEPRPVRPSRSVGDVAHVAGGRPTTWEVKPGRLTIEWVAHSNLTAEQKLDIMAALCQDGELDLDSEVRALLAANQRNANTAIPFSAHTHPSQSPAEESNLQGARPKVPQLNHQSVNNPGSDGKMQKGPTVSKSTGEIRSHSIYAEPENPDQSGLGLNGNSGHDLLTSQSYRGVGSPATKPNEEIGPYNTANTDTSLSTTPGSSISGTAAWAKKYSIDVEEWVRHQGHHKYQRRDSVGTEGGCSEHGTIKEFEDKLFTAQIHRQAEEEALERERLRLESLDIDSMELEQHEVERSLKHVERIVQEQEERMIEVHDVDLDRSEDEETLSALSDLQSSVTSMEAAGKLDDVTTRQFGKEDAAVSGKLEVSPEGGVVATRRLGPVAVARRRPRSARESDGEAPVDGSISEESGVYTQTSSDSRLRVSDAGSELHLAAIGAAASASGSAFGFGSTPHAGATRGADCSPHAGEGAPLMGAKKKVYRLSVFTPHSAGPASPFSLPVIQLEGNDSPGAVSDHVVPGSDLGLTPNGGACADHRLLMERDSWGDSSSMTTVVTAVHHSRSSASDFSSSTCSKGQKVEEPSGGSSQSAPALSTPQLSFEETSQSAAPDTQAGGAGAEVSIGGGDFTFRSQGSPIMGLTALSYESLSLKTPVIIDNGSGLCKCGLADEEAPSVVFPALVGRPKYDKIMSPHLRDTYVGDSAQRMRGVLHLKYPMEHGVVTDWDDMELIWSHALYDELAIDPEDHPILVTEAPLNPLAVRERMAEVLFETFQVPAVYAAIQAVLALYATGRTTGVVLDCGDGVSHTVPIYEGFALPHAIQRMDLAGRDLTDYLIRLLEGAGHRLTSSAERQIARVIKEEMCYVAADFRCEERRACTSENDVAAAYTLPDGRHVRLTTERFSCPEALFDPSLLGKELSGIHHSVLNSVRKSDIDLRRELLGNIILSGGTTMLPGLPDRLESEIAALVPTGMTSSVKVTCPAERQSLVWRGGAILAGLPSFSTAWLFSDEYQEYGTNLIHRKCF